MPCKCAKTNSGEERRERLQSYSRLGMLTRLTFAAMNPQGKSADPDVQTKFNHAYQSAMAFAAKPGGWLVLAGPSGSGKTHLAAAIANQCIEEGRPAFYVTAPDLLDHLRSSFNPASETPYDEFFEQVRNAPLLVLDDMGIQSTTAWAREKLDQLLNHRFSNQLPTIIVSIAPIASLDERIRTRLLTPGFCQIFELGEEKSALPTYQWSPEFELMKEMTFETFNLKRQLLAPEESDKRTLEERNNLKFERQENLKKAYELAVGIAESPKEWVVFQGNNGAGKTHLAAAIVNYRYKINKPALFVVVPDFLDHLRSTFSPESKTSYDRVFEIVKNTPFLVLDDFGQQSSTPWAQEKLFQVINHRYNAMLPTVITTTLTTDELDAPLLSRFLHPKVSTIFKIMVPDYRTGGTSPTGMSRIRKKGG